MALARTMASAVSSLRTRPSTRWEMNGSIIAISRCRARSLMASALAWSVATVAGSSGSMRVSILPPSKPASAIDCASYPVNRSSISKTVPARPPRFIEPMTTLSSSAPSSSRSSTMSAVPSTPSTPGLDRASDIRSSRSARSAMAIGRSPARSAPRAGWSAAMMKSWLSSPSSDVRRRRPAAASAMACGRRARASMMALIWSRTGSLPWRFWLGQELVDLGRRGHGVRAGQPGGHDGPGGVGEAHHPFGIPAREQPVAQRPAERVAGAEAVHDVDGHWRDLGGGRAVGGEDALGALLDDGELHARVVQLARRPEWFPGADGGVALVEVAHRHGRVRQRLLDPVPGLLAGRPEHRAVVQVEDGDVFPGSGPEGGQGGGAARLLGQAGDGNPEDAGLSDGVEVELAFVDLQVGGLGQAVEVQREVVGGEDLAEGHRRGQVLDRGDVAIVDAVVPERLMQEPAERVVAGAGDDGSAPPVPGRCDRDVGGAAAQVLAEALHLVESHADLLRVQVHADTAHGEHLVAGHGPSPWRFYGCPRENAVCLRF